MATTTTSLHLNQKYIHTWPRPLGPCPVRPSSHQLWLLRFHEMMVTDANKARQDKARQGKAKARQRQGTRVSFLSFPFLSSPSVSTGIIGWFLSSHRFWTDIPSACATSQLKGNRVYLPFSTIIVTTTLHLADQHPPANGLLCTIYEYFVQ
jgi:hypothetical protein